MAEIRDGVCVLSKGLWRKHTDNGFTASALIPQGLAQRIHYKSYVFAQAERLRTRAVDSVALDRRGVVIERDAVQFASSRMIPTTAAITATTRINTTRPFVPDGAGRVWSDSGPEC